MATLKEQVLELVSQTSGLTDREITDRLKGRQANQQPVNQACRQMETAGVLKRSRRHDGLIGNYPAGASRTLASAQSAVTRQRPPDHPKDSEWVDKSMKTAIQLDISLADRIRSFAYKAYVRPVLEAGKAQITIRVGDIHADMGLQNRMPAVCGALGSKIFEDQHGLEVFRRTGPPQGPNATFYFRLRGPNQGYVEPSAAVKEEHSSRLIHKAWSTPQDPSNAVYLVSCVSRKRTTRAAARDLYISDWFVKARRFAESSNLPWFILSAEHGLVAPDEFLEPYEKTLNAMSASERRHWAERVISQMSEKMPMAKRVVFLAGRRYREFLEKSLRNRGVQVDVPMEGLRIGEQLAWLSAQE